MQKLKLKPIEELRRKGYVYQYLTHTEAVVLENKNGSWKVFQLSDFDKEYVVDDDIKVLSNEEANEFKKIFNEVKE